LVGAGTYSLKKTERDRSSLIPKGVHWIKDAATSFDPENNLVRTQSHGDLHYKVMIVATGLVMEPSLIEGLEEALGKDGVCSNYVDPEYTWKVLQNFKGGNAVFTQPTTPIKCGGAPQKIAYLAADYFRMHNIDKRTKVIFATPGSVIFAASDNVPYSS
jgi:sulfide:quinone oxidoreductase